MLLGVCLFGFLGLVSFAGVLYPGLDLFLLLVLAPFRAAFPFVIFGLGGTLVVLPAFLVAFPVATRFMRRKPWYRKAAEELRTTGRTTIGGWRLSSSSSSSSWFSGGSSSSSSDSFSGGGGASGGW